MNVVETTDFSVRGMTCQNCARHVREALQAVPGVVQASVQLDAGRVTVHWRADAPRDVGAILQAVTAAGFTASAMDPGASVPPRRVGISSGWSLNLALGVPVTAVLMLGEWAFGLGMTRWFQWLAFALAALVQLICGARFYVGAWRQARAGRSNMDTLVALGSTTAFAYSLWALAHGAHVYFMEAAAIITLISAGHWLESRMSERAAGSMKKLLDLAPTEARRKRTDGSEETVPVSALRSGDLVVLRPGDRVPTDGAVIEGASSVDESMLTGESLPVDKAAGAPVYGGTLNVNSILTVRVTATGAATALAQIIAAVERAQNSRAGIQRLGDRVSNVFVPVVVLVALAAGLWWGLAPHAAATTAEWLSRFLWPVHLHEAALALAFVHAAAVLIIACPCAIGLATPAAIMAGTNAAAERGILIRDGIALEKAGTITAVVFDKTGTLTAGKPAVTRHEVFTNTTDALATAGELARHSNHPLSRAIATWQQPGVAFPANPEGGSSGPEIALPGKPAGISFAPRGLGFRPVGGAPWKPLARFSPPEWQEIGGAGVQARMHGRLARLGSVRWLEESGVAVEPGRGFIADATRSGATVVGLAFDAELAALFALQDTVKDGAADVVKTLVAQGLAVHLITGDHRSTAEAVAATLGIPAVNVAAEVRPARKAELVKELQARGMKVAFVGDGINDAPALEQADLGIAVARASDVARMAADIVLLKSDVQAIPEGLGLARATLRTIRQNLFWAFFYNAAAIPLAAMGFLSPVLCALAMGLSDVVVIGNALRLRGRGKREL